MRDVGGDPALGLDALLQGVGHGVDGPREIVGLVAYDAADGVPDPDVGLAPGRPRLAAAAALRSRRESWPPMSTPSAQPPKTTEIEPMTRAWSRSFMTVGAAVGEAGVQGQHAPVAERDGGPDVGHAAGLSET